MRNDPVKELQHRLFYRFHNLSLLTQALTHKSSLNEMRGGGMRDNETLEFLGDAVLNLVVSEVLLSLNPEADEGFLSRARASLVSEPVLSKIAGQMSLGGYLDLGRGEEMTGGRSKSSLLADALEAVIGAIFLDGGFTAAKRSVEKLFETELSSRLVGARDKDFKTRLQEYSQKAYNQLPTYNLRKSSGPDHRKHFEVEVRVAGKIQGRGTGSTKKEAEQEAAREALRILEAGISGSFGA